MAKVGIAHIYASYNNIHITVTDITGAETLDQGDGRHGRQGGPRRVEPVRRDEGGRPGRCGDQGEGVRHPPRPGPAPGGNRSRSPVPAPRPRSARSRAPGSRSSGSRT